MFQPELPILTLDGGQFCVKTVADLYRYENGKTDSRMPCTRRLERPDIRVKRESRSCPKTVRRYSGLYPRFRSIFIFEGCYTCKIQ